MQKALDRMHLLMATNALTANPNHNKQFDIHVDPHMHTMLVCKQGVSICNFLGLNPCIHMGITHMHTGIHCMHGQP